MATSTPGSRLNAQVYEEACEWLVMMRTGIPDASGRKHLDVWLRKSPEHVRAYLEVSAIWEDVALHDPQHTVSADKHVARALAADNIVPFELPASSQPDRSLSHGDQADSASSTPLTEVVSAHNRGRMRLLTSLSRRAGRPRAMSMRVAAIAAPVAVIASVCVWLQFHGGMYTTEVGEQRSITLADGSVIDLNARSRIKVHLSKTERDVELLQGQALFQVAHDPGRPFVVRSGAAFVRVVGTLFDVYRKKNGTTVTVIEGRVAVTSSFSEGGSGAPGSLSVMEEKGSDAAVLGGPSASPGHAGEGRRAAGEVLLSAGEQLTVAREALEQPTHADIAAATSWTRRRLIFDSAPLSEVVDEFNRYNTRQLVIDDPALNEFGVVGVFSSTDPGSLLRFLSAQPGIAVDEDGTQIRITRK